MRAATDADFDASSRYLAVKVEIYFNGISAQPFTVSKDNFLIDIDWLEESGAESSNPFGAVSSNELSFRLYNEAGMFSPTNASGQFYEKIRTGVKVIPYIRPLYDDEEVEWLKLGEYFVTGWEAAITGTYADVTANDAWHQIFSSPAPNYPVQRNVAFNTALTDIYEAMGFTVIVNPAISDILMYSFIEDTPLNFTQEMLSGAAAFCTCNKAGQPIIEPFVLDRATRISLTDGDQIKSVAATQSISKTYDGVELTYAIPQGLDQEKLVDLQGITATPGAFSVQNVALNNGPLWQITSVSIIGLGNVKLLDYTATPWLASFLFTNLGSHTVFNLLVYGHVVGFTNIVLTDSANKLLKITSRYIQKEEYAQHYKSVLTSFVTNSIATLTVSIRGNPLLNVGDKVVLQSTKYKLDFTGVVQRLSYRYSGSLSCEMSLINNDILQEVQP